MKSYLIAVALLCAGGSVHATGGADAYTKPCAGCHGLHGEKSTGGARPINGLEQTFFVGRMTKLQEAKRPYVSTAGCSLQSHHDQF